MFSGIGLCDDSFRRVLPSVVCLRWGLHEAVLHATCKQVQLPVRKQVWSKLSIPIRCWNGKAGHSASSVLVHRLTSQK